MNENHIQEGFYKLRKTIKDNGGFLAAKERLDKLIEAFQERQEDEEPRRMSKAKVKEILTSGTPEERVKMFADNNYIISKGGRAFLTPNQQIKIFSGLGDKDFKRATNLFTLWRTMQARRTTFALYYQHLLSISNTMNYNLQILDIYTLEGYKQNFLLDKLYFIYGKGEVMRAMEGGGEIPEPGQGVINVLKIHKTISPLVKLDYNKESGYFVVDDEKIYKKFREELRPTFEVNLSNAKMLSIMLYQFADKYNIKEFIPFDLKNYIRLYKQEWAASPSYSSKEYKKLLKSRDLTDAIKAMKMEDNGNIGYLFPSYDEVKVDEDFMNNNNIFEADLIK